MWAREVLEYGGSMIDILTIFGDILASLLATFIFIALGILGINGIYRLLVYLEMD
jgi:hypothetical protein